MTYARPTFAELLARINVDLAVLPAPLADALAAMWAKACHSQHGHLDWIAKQASPLTCDLEYLADWATLYAVPRLQAVAARGQALATGTTGAVIPADTLARAGNGLDYRVTAAATISGSTAVAMRCTTAGAATNLVSGLTLTLIDPIAQVNSTLTVGTLGITGGADIETVDAWRLRVVEEWQAAVQYGGRSGKVADYKAWAKAAHPSVSGALIQPQAMGPGTVLIRPICNDLVNRLPSSTVKSDIMAFLPGVVPAVADYRVADPIIRAVAISLELTPTAYTAGNRAAITDILSDLVMSKTSENAVLLLTDIDAAVLSVTSGFTRLAPTANITAGNGEVLVLSPVNYTVGD